MNKPDNHIGILPPILQCTPKNDDAVKLNNIISAAQTASKELRNEIISKLNILKKAAFSEQFWSEFLKECFNKHSEVNMISSFVMFILGEDTSKYEYEFPVAYNQLLVYNTSNITLLTDRPFEDQAENPHTGVLHNNLFQILAYILVTKLKYDNSALKGYLRKTIGLNFKSPNKFISNLRELNTKITNCITKEKQTQEINQKRLYYNFWHRELSKRRFLLENSPKRTLEDFMNSSELLLLLDKQTCLDSCRLLHPIHCDNIQNKITHTSELECNEILCYIKKRMCLNIVFPPPTAQFSYLFSNECFTKYKYLLTDLINPLSAKSIAEYFIEKHKLPPSTLAESEINAITFRNQPPDKRLYLENNEYKKTMKNRLKYIENQAKDDRHDMDTESLIIGLHFWDEQYLNNKNTNKNIVFRQLVKQAFDKELFITKIIKQKYYLDKKEEHMEFCDAIVDFCHKHYIRVLQTIKNNNCKLLSINKALHQYSSLKNDTAHGTNFHD